MKALSNIWNLLQNNKVTKHASWFNVNLTFPVPIAEAVKHGAGQEMHGAERFKEATLIIDPQISLISVTWN